ncbi:pentatricopeptide repeat-containing protein At5g62370-like [Alnus glutinosa]|uniref:pentatricopeptide repeat-containing protein At5g62370-like n=1 Tax=Alnus glutinosa TaxID=3517 RepID=UPI002D796528|nr:pentatricopeptide repeat-containing protein At5g62370-like [Alnus glutinosa]
MIKRRPSAYYYYCFFRNRREITTCSLPLDPPNASISSLTNDHKSLCLSLAEQLIQRGLLSSAQQVVQRIISHSSSASDAISIVHFAEVRGLDIDLGSYGAVIRKLMSLGQLQLAEVLFLDRIVGRGFVENAEDRL